MEKLSATMGKFFHQLERVINVSEEIRDLNSQMNNIQHIDDNAAVNSGIDAKKAAE